MIWWHIPECLVLGNVRPIWSTLYCCSSCQKVLYFGNFWYAYIYLSQFYFTCVIKLHCEKQTTDRRAIAYSEREREFTFAKMAEPIQMSLEADSYGSKEPCIRWGQDRTNPFTATRGDKSMMRPCARLLRTLVEFVYVYGFVRNCSSFSMFASRLETGLFLALIADYFGPFLSFCCRKAYLYVRDWWLIGWLIVVLFCVILVVCFLQNVGQ